MKHVNIIHVFSRILMCLLLMTASLGAVTSIDNDDEFRENVTRRFMVVAYFYSKGKDIKDPFLDETMKMFENIDRDSSPTVRFIKINVERPGLAHLRPIFKINQTPVFLLFKAGKPVTRIDGQKPLGFISQNIRGAINQQFGKDIDKIEKQIIRKRQLEAATAPAFGYPYYGYPFGGPYYSPYYYPWGGLGFGFGVGF